MRPMLNLRNAILIAHMLSFLTFSVCSEQAASKNGDFEKLIESKIHDLYSGDAGFSVMPIQKENILFVLYGDDPENPGAFETIQCQQTAIYDMYITKGTIMVGICNNHHAEIQRHAKDSKDKLNAVLASLSNYIDQNNSGLQYKHSEIDRDLDLYFYPVILIGHGFNVLPTSIAISNNNAIVVQASLSICNHPANSNLKICNDIEGSLSTLAKNVYLLLN